MDGATEGRSEGRGLMLGNGGGMGEGLGLGEGEGVGVGEETIKEPATILVGFDLAICWEARNAAPTTTDTARTTMTGMSPF